jgi:homoserine kinase type II
MAVFTALTRAEAASFLTQFTLGELVDLQGIASGIENTNYFLTTSQGRYVLT